MSHRTHALLFFLLAAVLGACSATPSNRAEGQETTTGPRTLRVLTYNLHHGEGTDGVLDLERIARVIEGADVDLVALQEVDRGCERTGGVDQLAWLAERLEMDLSFAKFMDFQGGEYGLGILSRLEPLGAWAIELPPGEREPRAAAAIRVPSPLGGELVFVSAHFDWLSDDTARFAQANALIAALEGEPSVVLAGDLNDVPGSRTIGALDAAFLRHGTEGGARREPQLPWSFPSDRPDRQIDFVMYRHPGQAHPGQTQEVAAGSSITGTTEVLEVPVVSDHCPVLAVLRLRDPAPIPASDATGTR